MSAKPARFAALALARATAAALAEARWEAADHLSRHPRALTCELLAGRAGELAFSPLASDQILAIALQCAADDVAQSRPPLAAGAHFFHGRTAGGQAEGLEGAWPQDPEADLRLVRDVEERLRGQGLDGTELAARLGEEATLQEGLWADPRLPAGPAVRWRMRSSAEALRERARALDPRLLPDAPRGPRREPLAEAAPGDVELDALRHPPILLGDQDHERLRSLAFSMLMSDPRAAAPLLRELDRADVVPDEAVPPDVVRLGSWVEYADLLEGSTGRAKLVGSRQETGPGELSVLSPTGAALIGLSVGQSILWRDHVGVQRLVIVREVSPG